MAPSKTATISALLFFAGLLFYTDVARSQQITAPWPPEKIPDAILPHAMQAVVKISAGEKQADGAGIVIGKTRSGLPVIVTVNGLINGREDKITIRAAGRGQAVAGRVISEKWRNRDLVLLAAHKPLPVAATLAYGHAEQLAPGENVAVLGFSASNSLAQNPGQIVRNEANHLMFNFVMADGQTGGPVLDANGHVIGIAISRPQELGQAIPIDLVLITLQQWLGKTQLVEPWQEGKTSKNWRGWVVAGALLIATGVAVGVSGVF